jgi:O-antigen ligase
MFLPFEQGTSMKLLRIAGQISLLLIILSPRKYIKSDVKYISLCILILSIITFAWFRIYKNSDSLYIGAYINYRDWSLAGVFSALSFLVIASKRPYSELINKMHLVISLIVNIALIIYAYYQYFVLQMDRILLSLAYGPNATAAAYIISFVSLYAMASISSSLKKHKLEALSVLWILNYTALIMTGTRAAIIAYPIAFIIMCYMEYKDKKIHISKKSLSILFILVAIIIASMAKPIMHRVDNLRSDLTQYSEDNSNTSVGARFAMYKTGWLSSYDNIAGQSLEQRNERIEKIVESDKSLSAALIFRNVHLHNQFVDTLSTTGWLGLIFDLLLIVSIAMFAGKNKTSVLYAFLTLFIMFGLSDTLTYAKPIPLGWLLPLIFICSLYKNRKV